MLVFANKNKLILFLYLHDQWACELFGAQLGVWTLVN